MARLAGVDLPLNKKMEIGLTYIYGIGNKVALEILEATGIDPETRVKDLTDGQIAALRTELEDNRTVEGDLRTEIAMNIKRLKDIKCYRGMRHMRRLPVRGQRTKTNARTRKGKVKTMPNKKK